jgi:hypothetical protein
MVVTIAYSREALRASACVETRWVTASKQAVAFEPISPALDMRSCRYNSERRRWWKVDLVITAGFATREGALPSLIDP